MQSHRLSSGLSISKSQRNGRAPEIQGEKQNSRNLSNKARAASARRAKALRKPRRSAARRGRHAISVDLGAAPMVKEADGVRRVVYVLDSSVDQVGDAMHQSCADLLGLAGSVFRSGID